MEENGNDVALNLATCYKDPTPEVGANPPSSCTLGNSRSMTLTDSLSETKSPSHSRDSAQPRPRPHPQPPRPRPQHDHELVRDDLLGAVRLRRPERLGTGLDHVRPGLRLLVHHALRPHGESSRVVALSTATRATESAFNFPGAPHPTLTPCCSSLQTHSATGKPIMAPKKNIGADAAKIGKATTLSDGDVEVLNKMYCTDRKLKKSRRERERERQTDR
jgi:hypothetical protein